MKEYQLEINLGQFIMDVEQVIDSLYVIQLSYFSLQLSKVLSHISVWVSNYSDRIIISTKVAFTIIELIYFCIFKIIKESYIHQKSILIYAFS